MTIYNNSVNEYSSWENLNMFSYNCISYLMNNNENIWKLLFYLTPDALDKPNLTMSQKRNLIYKGQVDSSLYRIFMDGGNNDAFDQQCTILKVYPIVLIPDNKIVGTASIEFDCLSHYKVNTLNTYSLRSLTIIQELIKTLNGAEIEGLGVLSFDRKGSSYNKGLFNLSNDKSYSGYSLVMSTHTA